MSTTDTSVDSATDAGSADQTSTDATPADTGTSGAVASDTTSSTSTDAGTNTVASNAGSSDGGGGSSDSGAGSTDSGAGSTDSAASSTDNGAGSMNSALGATDSGAGSTDSKTDASSPQTSPAGSAAPATGATATIDYKAIVAIPSGINDGLSSAGQATMLNAFGNPGTLDPKCGPSSAKLAPLMKTANVGPFRVTGFGPAVDALTRVFAAVKSSLPDLYALLGTEGMLCVRYVRDSTTNISNHAWGTAIDITIGGIETARGSTKVTQGLLSLCPFMHDEQFFWGAGFSPTPDGMHFEASNELITAWKANGTIP